MIWQEVAVRDSTVCQPHSMKVLLLVCTVGISPSCPSSLCLHVIRKVVEINRSFLKVSYPTADLAFLGTEVEVFLEQFMRFFFENCLFCLLFKLLVLDPSGVMSSDSLYKIWEMKGPLSIHTTPQASWAVGSMTCRWFWDVSRGYLCTCLKMGGMDS